MSFGNQICPEKSPDLRRTKTDTESNFSTVLQLIKSEGERQKEDNSRKETELEGLVEDIIYNQYQSLDESYGRLTRVYMKGAHHRIKRASSLSCSSLDSEYFSSVVNTVEALETQKSTETNELEANEVTQIRAKNAELEKALSELHAKLKNNEKRAMPKTSDLMALIEEKVKRYRNEASKQKKEFTDKIKVMQQNLESVCNKNTNLESQQENQRENVSQYLIQIKNLEENLAETVSTKQNLLEEKQRFIERITELESQCSKEKDLEEQSRDLESVCNKNTALESQQEDQRENVSQYLIRIKNLEENLAETVSTKQNLLEEKLRFIERITELESQCSKAKDLEEQLRDLESVCNKNTDLESQLENQREKVSQYLIRIKNLEENLAETVSTKQNLLEEKQCFIERITELEFQCSKAKDLEEQLRDLESVCNKNTDLESQLENQREKVSQYLIRIKNLEENLAETVSTKQNLLEEKQCFTERITELESQCSKEKDLEEQLRDLESVCNKNTDLESQLENQREKVSQYLIRIKNLEENLAETVPTKQNLLEEKQCFIERITELESQCSKEKDLEEQLRDLESVCNKNTDLESQLENQREKVSQYLIEIKNMEESLAETVSTKQNLLEEKLRFIERITELESQCSKEKDLEKQLRDLESVCNKNTDLESQLENQREKVSQYLIRIKNLEENLAETVSTKQNLLEEKLRFIERITELESQCSKEKDLEEQLRDLESVCNKNTDLESQLENQRENVSQYLILIKNLEENLAETVSTKQNLLEEKQCFIDRITELESQCSKVKDLEEQLIDLESVCNKNTDLEPQLENQREKVSQYLIRIKNLEENLAETVSTKQNLLEEKQCFIERIMELESQCSKEKDLEEKLIDVEFVCNKNTDLESQLENQREKVSQYLIEIKNMEANLAETVSTKQNLLEEKQHFIERITELESQCSKEKDLEEQLRDAMWEINALHKKKSELKLQNEQSQKEYSEAIKKLTETIDLTHEENKHSKTNKQLMERKMEELAEGVRQKMEDNIRILHRRVHVTELLNNENKDTYKSTKQKHEEESKVFGEKIAEYEDEIRMLREKVLKLEANMSMEGEKMNLMKTVTQLERKTMKLEKKLKEKDCELVSLGESKKEAIRQLCFLADFHRDRCLYLKDSILNMRIKNMK
ncbi:hypothetical protein KIW84_025409 [Lathyrus oleraceus]|uniref:NAB domain-containing protein n=3 Tax=Pisum sativum TaxID=3888 RepID=A0A9D4YIA0_PEA|nr:hypothetical protein KIW84_025409 [Pisum sativum]